MYFYEDPDLVFQSEVPSTYEFYRQPSHRLVDYPVFIRPANICVRCFITGKDCHGFREYFNGNPGVCGQCRHDGWAIYCKYPKLYLANPDVPPWHIRYMSRVSRGPYMITPYVGYDFCGHRIRYLANGDIKEDDRDMLPIPPRDLESMHHYNFIQHHI
ncbi:hypothetical protein BJV82DRAFT_661885 [Fennellomyces sp. T-0311]|nr:hypothetical protein BJV82DRAFT_661885 [Fennellomyces sp. T-0311]